jgi:hypothetical protein
MKKAVKKKTKDNPAMRFVTQLGDVVIIRKANKEQSK